MTLISSNYLNFDKPGKENAGVYTVKVQISDGMDNPTYSFLLAVINTAPYF